jgi:hypothetical protein
VEVQAQRGGFRTKEANEAFVDESVKRLSGRVPPGQLRDLQNRAAEWRASGSQSDFITLTDAISAAALKNDVKSDVTINASRGTGASVKYQTLGQRQRNEPPTTAKSLTEVVESMVLGMYHIWTERGGKETSDRNAQFDIAAAKESVLVEER